MLTTGDWTQMIADAAAIRGDNEETIVILRGTATLTGQAARIILNSGLGARWAASNQAREARSGVFILGGTALDVAVEDRFSRAGRLYRVKFVHPNRRARTVAEADIVE
jgi:hypothetical protein